MKKLKIIIQILLFIIIITLFLYLPKINVVNDTFSKKFSYVNDSTSFTSDQSTIQIDKTLEIKVISKLDLNPLNSTYQIIYNTYTVANVTASDIAIVKVSRNSIFDFKWKIDEIRTGLIHNKPFSEAVSLAQKYDLSKENPDPANITVFAPLQPSASSQSSDSLETLVIPSQGGLK